MGRYRGPVCKLCRREGIKLHLKGERCYTDKCAIERRNYPPGQHGLMRSRFTDYGIHLREKQKVKRMYGILEKQFKKYFEIADRKKGITGDNLLILLERRLDNVVYKLGFCCSVNEARQFVRHGHFMVNGGKVDIPSYLVKVGDVISIKDKSKDIARIVESLEAVEKKGIPDWLELDKDSFKGIIKSLPTRESILAPIKEQLIVEYYSK
jgi:small subunit ribosomal protein S4